MAGDAGGDAAFSRFVERSRASLTRTAWFLVGNADTAADLVQEAYVRTYVAWGRVRPEGALAYARKVLVNANVDRVRRRHGEVVTSEWDGVASSMAAYMSGPGDMASVVATRLEVARLLERLPRRQRQVVVLRYVTDLSEEDTASLLGISVGSVKSAASRALAVLRERAEVAEGVWAS